MLSITLINKTQVPERERDDFSEINDQLQALAVRRLDSIDLRDDPYRQSKIGWKIAVFSNAMTHRFISLAEGVALSWNNSNVLSAVLNARAMIETVAIYWEFESLFSKLIGERDFGAVDRLAMNYLFSTRDVLVLKDAPELKARQVLTAIDLIDKTIIPHFRSHYDRLSEFCHPNSFGHRALFSQLDHKTGVTAFVPRSADHFVVPIKCALGAVEMFQHAKTSIDQDIVDFCAAHHASHPSPLVNKGPF